MAAAGAREPPLRRTAVLRAGIRVPLIVCWQLGLALHGQLIGGQQHADLLRSHQITYLNSVVMPDHADTEDSSDGGDDDGDTDSEGTDEESQ